MDDEVGDDEQDWRLQAELDVQDTRGALQRLVGGLRGPDVVKEIEDAVAKDVVITHDGALLFAYAADQTALADARAEIEGVLRREGIGASVRVSHWDEALDRWVQSDPPLTAEERGAEEAETRDAEAIETRTMVVSSGKMIRAELEQSMREWADRLGLECTTIEHPHLLTTQVAFTITGPRVKVDEFARGLRAEEYQTLRAERGVMISPL